MPRRKRNSAGNSFASSMKSALVSMTKRSFIQEHKHLVKVLRKGSLKDRIKEAKEQQQELNKYLDKV